MAKYYGKIGYYDYTETAPGVHTKIITERSYKGDLIRNTKKFQNSGYVNDNISISNQISIVADPYAFKNFHKIQYVEWMGNKWTVSDIEVQYPRLVLSIGGIYNGEQA